MFDIIPNLLSSIITFLFPIFASYKALRTSDPAQLAPWLMYWVVLSCFSLAESWTWLIVSWLPFYAYFRLLLLSYLVLPQTQGARLLYQSHIDPFLATYERDIDNLITHAHDHAKSAGLSSLKRLIDFVKQNLLGMQPQQTQPSFASLSQGRETSYAQTLLSRFALPSARQGFVAPASDFYGLLNAAVAQVGAGGSRVAQVDETNRSGTTLIPPGLTSAADKRSFLATQRERLRTLLSALDREASGLEIEEHIERDIDSRLGATGVETEDRGGASTEYEEGLRKSKSEAEFEAIEREDWSGAKAAGSRKSGGHGGGGGGGGGGGSWLPWGIWAMGTQQASQKGEQDSTGSSSAVER